MIYRFEDQSLDTESLELRRDNQTVPVEPQVFSLLAYLLKNQDKVVSKDELIEAIWDGRAISDGALNSRINAARRAVGDSGEAQAIIKTFPRRGFRFVAEVRKDSGNADEREGIASLTNKPTIAVLPFDNVSGDPRQDFIGDGIATDVIAALSRSRLFFVIARNSTFQYRGTSPDVRQVARDLNVRYIVEGSARKAEDSLRVSVQLIDGVSGRTVWSGVYDRELKDLFQVQDELTLAIVGQLKPELSRAEIDRVKSRSTDELDAWELYHRGIHFMHRLTSDDQVEARRFFEAALKHDPTFAPTYAAIAYVTFMKVLFTSISDVDAKEAVEFGKRAIELDDQDPRCHFSLAWAYVAERDYENAVLEAELALELDPSFASAYHLLATCFVHTGRAAEAIALLDNAIALSPRDPEIGLYLARKACAYLYLGRHEEAAYLSPFDR